MHWFPCQFSNQRSTPTRTCIHAPFTCALANSIVNIPHSRKHSWLIIIIEENTHYKCSRICEFMFVWLVRSFDLSLIGLFPFVGFSLRGWKCTHELEVCGCLHCYYPVRMSGHTDVSCLDEIISAHLTGSTGYNCSSCWYDEIVTNLLLFCSAVATSRFTRMTYFSLYISFLIPLIYSICEPVPTDSILLTVQ